MHGQELITLLEKDIARIKGSIADRQRRINAGWVDVDDCFLSQDNDALMLRGAKDKIAIIKAGGCAWFKEYATLEGWPVQAKWVDGAWGKRLRVFLPEGKTIWTSAKTAKGLAKHGIKAIAGLRPAWLKLESQGISVNWSLFPSEKNYSTGEAAGTDPVQVQDYEIWEAAGFPQPWED